VGDNHGPNNPLLSAHPGGINGALGDGSVRFIAKTLDMLTLRRLATRDDGQTLGEF
jgi:prepilin-type processing-associated H-X9-DG protein